MASPTSSHNSDDGLSEGEYMVEQILDWELNRWNNNRGDDDYDPLLGPTKAQLRYLVRWKGYDSSADSWEPRESFITWDPAYDTTIAQILKKNPGKKKPIQLEVEASDLNAEERKSKKRALEAKAKGKKGKKGKGKSSQTRESSAAPRRSESVASTSTIASTAPRPRGTRNSEIDPQWSITALNDFAGSANAPKGVRDLVVDGFPRRDSEGRLMQSSESAEPEDRKPRVKREGTEGMGLDEAGFADDSDDGGAQRGFADQGFADDGQQGFAEAQLGFADDHGSPGLTGEDQLGFADDDDVEMAHAGEEELGFADDGDDDPAAMLGFADDGEDGDQLGFADDGEDQLGFADDGEDQRGFAEDGEDQRGFADDGDEGADQGDGDAMLGFADDDEDDRGFADDGDEAELGFADDGEAEPVIKPAPVVGRAIRPIPAASTNSSRKPAPAVPSPSRVKPARPVKAIPKAVPVATTSSRPNAPAPVAPPRARGASTSASKPKKKRKIAPESESPEDDEPLATIARARASSSVAKAAPVAVKQTPPAPVATTSKPAAQQPKVDLSSLRIPRKSEQPPPAPVARPPPPALVAVVAPAPAPVIPAAPPHHSPDIIMGAPSIGRSTDPRRRPSDSASSGSRTKPQTQRPPTSQEVFNSGVQRRPDANNPLIPLNTMSLAQSLRAMKFFEPYNNNPKYPRTLSDDERIRKIWNIGDPTVNFHNFDGVLRSSPVEGKARLCYIYAPQRDNSLSKMSRTIKADYVALQFLLSSIEGVQQSSALDQSVNAVFVHVSEMEEIGKRQGKLGDLEHFRDRPMGHTIFVLFGATGTEEKSEKVFRSFWIVDAAITFTPAALSQDPDRFSSDLVEWSSSRQLWPGRRNVYSWAHPSYLFKGGPFHIPLPSEMTSLTEVQRQATYVFHSSAREEHLSLVQVLPMSVPTPPPTRSTMPTVPVIPLITSRFSDPFSKHPLFPTELNEQEYDLSALKQLDKLYNAPELNRTTLERILPIVVAYRSQNLDIRRWIVVATEEERQQAGPQAGIIVASLEETENTLKQPHFQIPH